MDGERLDHWGVCGGYGKEEVNEDSHGDRKVKGVIQ